jgi:hypothetical protein
MSIDSLSRAEIRGGLYRLLTGDAPSRMNFTTHSKYPTNVPSTAPDAHR